MATSTAEVVRDREETSEAPAASPATAPPPVYGLGGAPFSSPIESIAASGTGGAAGLVPKIAESMATQRTTMEQGIQEMRPYRQAVVDAGAKRDAAASQMPALPKLEEPPSRGLREFLAVGENENPLTSIAKLTQAMALFIGQMSGAVRGDAVGALTAWNGALQGWAQGDRERADRAYKDWEAKTDKAITEYKLGRQRWEDILFAADKSLEQKIAELGIYAAENKDTQALAALDTGNLLTLYGIADGRDKAAQDLTRWSEEMKFKREGALATQKYREAVLAETKSFHDAQKAKWAAEERRAREVADAYTPEDFKMLGQQYAMTGRLPPNIARGKDGQRLMPKIIEGAREWAREQGIDPMTFPAIQAGVKAAGVALNDTQKRKNVALASVGTFERHMDHLVELGKKVPRSEMPAINKAIIEGQRSFGGSVEASNYVLMAFEASQEFAKISVGTAQGDAGTRDEARKALSVAMTQQQLEGARDTLKQAAAQRVKGWEDAEHDMLRIIGTAGKDRTTTAGGGGGAKKRTVTLPNGKTVTVEEQ